MALDASSTLRDERQGRTVAVGLATQGAVHAGFAARAAPVRPTAQPADQPQVKLETNAFQAPTQQ